MNLQPFQAPGADIDPSEPLDSGAADCCKHQLPFISCMNFRSGLQAINDRAGAKLVVRKVSVQVRRRVNGSPHLLQPTVLQDGMHGKRRIDDVTLAVDVS